jgi:hypothetical protein
MKNIKQIQQQIISPVSAACINTSCDTQLKPKFLTKEERSMFSLTADLKAILVGLTLGDLNIQKHGRSINAKLCFEQGLVHKDYLFHLYDLFKSYCRSVPKTTNRLPDKRTGQTYTRVTIKTRSLPCFNELYDLFYCEGKKIIPANINDLLTVSSLAYWLCDDGSFCKSTHRVYFCTESFTLEEVNLLIKIIDDKWNLKCYKVKRGNGYRIVIPRVSLSILQGLLKDIMPPMMLHKLGL